MNKKIILVIITLSLLLITAQFCSAGIDIEKKIKYNILPESLQMISNNLQPTKRINGNSERSIFGEPQLKDGWPKIIDWYYDPDDQIYYYPGLCEPVVDDIDNDGTKEIITYIAGNPTQIYIFNDDGTVHNGWPVEVLGTDMPGGNVISPSVADIDNDGYKEIIVDGHEEYYIYNHDGSLHLTIDANGYAFFVNAETIFFDLDNDDSIEIVVKNNCIYNNEWWNQAVVYDSQGNIMPGWPVRYMNTNDGAIYFNFESAPAIGNFDDDLEKEIVIVDNRHITQPSTHFEGQIHVLNLDGSYVPGFPCNIDGTIHGSPSIGDINNDGYDEIVIGTVQFENVQHDSGLYVIDRYGNNLTNWPQLGGVSILPSPALVDFEGDGYLEIVQGTGYYATSDPFDTYVFDYQGNVLPGWPQTKLWYDIRSSVVGDITGDGQADIITTIDDTIYAWDMNGNTIDYFPMTIEPGYCMLGAVTVDDVDGDGNVELIAGTSSEPTTGAYLYIWELQEIYNQDAMQWPMFQHDTKHSGLYGKCSAGPNTPIIDGPLEGNAGEEYEYTFSATHPEDGDVLLFIDWGDNSSSGWIGPYNSGQEIIEGHTWDERGTYIIRAKAKDNNGLESNWGTLEVVMPVKQQVTNTLLQMIWGLFPNVFPILRLLFRL